MQTVSIPDMSCGHCKATVEAALSALPGTMSVAVDLAERRAMVDTSATPDAILAALAGAGYPATLVR